MFYQIKSDCHELANKTLQLLILVYLTFISMILKSKYWSRFNEESILKLHHHHKIKFEIKPKVISKKKKVHLDYMSRFLDYTDWCQCYISHNIYLCYTMQSNHVSSAAWELNYNQKGTSWVWNQTEKDLLFIWMLHVHIAI